MPGITSGARAKKRQIARAAEKIAVGDVGDQVATSVPDGGGENAQFESIVDRPLGIAVLKKREAESYCNVKLSQVSGSAQALESAAFSRIQ